MGVHSYSFISYHKIYAMKKILTLLFALLTVLVQAGAQTDTTGATAADTPEAVARLDSLVTSALKIGDYKMALRLNRDKTEALKRLYGETDSAYISTYATLAPLLYRTGDIDAAIAVSDSAASMYAANVSSADARYAFIVDNLGFYYASAGRYAEAEPAARKALAVYEKFYRNDYDLAVILTHAAEACAGNGKPKDAVAFEVRCLNIMKQLYGEHSDPYLAEAEYLVHYYGLAGDGEAAAELRARIDRLKAEAGDGVIDIPDPGSITSAEKAAWYNREAAVCADYLLNVSPEEAARTSAAAFLISWADATADVSVPVIEMITKPLSDERDRDFFVVYVAAVVSKSFAAGEKTLSSDDYAEAMETMVRYYEANRDYFGANDVLDGYAKLVRKGKFRKMAAAAFEEALKEAPAVR